MSCERYLSLEEFFASPYACAVASCCSISGEALSGLVGGLIDEAQVLVDNYLGKELCYKTYTDTFVGDDSDSYFVRNLPIDATGEITLSRRMNKAYATAPINEPIETDWFYLDDTESGLIRFIDGFKNYYTYKISYSAGYTQETMPRAIKTAISMLVVNLSQRIDNMNMSAIDFSVDSIKVDKASSTTFGQSGMIKQVVAKSVSELNELPINVMKILMKYKHNSSM